MSKLVRRLCQLGHRRIALITREERLSPEPGIFERNFLKELGDFGLPTGPYNLPVWESSQRGLKQCLEELFRHTPPTAMLTDEPHHFIAIQN